MHATDTLDFMVVIDGRIVLGLDDGEHELGPGDVVVQRGNVHRWRVAGDEPCTYVVCMVRPDPARPGGRSRWRRRRPQRGDGRAASSPATRRRRHVVRARRRLPALRASPGADDGVALVELWQSGGPLASPEQGGDPEGGWELEPRGGGVAFRWVRLPAGHDPGEAGWHTTHTIDVDIVVSGRLELSLPDTRPGRAGSGRGRRAARHPPQVAAGRRRTRSSSSSLMLAVG